MVEMKRKGKEKERTSSRNRLSFGLGKKGFLERVEKERKRWIEFIKMNESLRGGSFQGVKIWGS